MSDSFKEPKGSNAFWDSICHTMTGIIASGTLHRVQFAINASLLSILASCALARVGIFSSVIYASGYRHLQWSTTAGGLLISTLLPIILMTGLLRVTAVSTNFIYTSRNYRADSLRLARLRRGTRMIDRRWQQLLARARRFP
ncbi:hypothetical protein CPB84DRAFT_755562 [Gymnopilus junonius]|uniref:Transmembrane protein n=1 Tax=Gymnopilus junonius TaxID=109634 RepID=A0A9P5TTA7_GYMJU|nr:hypothetical protein CPB84DRAFT_755562 [Gymnopilus junonius]